MTSDSGGPPVVLHVLEAVRSGTSRHLVDVVRTVSSVTHHVVVPPPARSAVASGADYDGAAVEAMSASGAEIHQIDMARSPVHLVNVRALHRLRRLIRDVTPSVIHGHSTVGGVLARAVSIGSDIPTVYTPNALLTDRRALAVERVLGRWTDRMIAVSPSEARHMRDLHLVDPNRIVVIANGIDLDRHHLPPVGLRAMLDMPDAVPMVGMVARVVCQKAPEAFVAVCGIVAAKLPDAHFVLIGKGPLQSQLDRAIETAGLGTRFGSDDDVAFRDYVLAR